MNFGRKERRSIAPHAPKRRHRANAKRCAAKNVLQRTFCFFLRRVCFLSMPRGFPSTPRGTLSHLRFQQEVSRIHCGMPPCPSSADNATDTPPRTPQTSQSFQSPPHPHKMRLMLWLSFLCYCLCSGVCVTPPWCLCGIPDVCVTPGMNRRRAFESVDQTSVASPAL